MKRKYTVEMTREELVEAHKALDEVCHIAEHGNGHRPSKAREQVLAALPPKPRPTMAEIGWDEDEHYLAEAVHPKYGKVAMYCIGLTGEWIGIMHWDGENVDYFTSGLAELEPTGKHYFRNDKN